MKEMLFTPRRLSVFLILLFTISFIAAACGGARDAEKLSRSKNPKDLEKAGDYYSREINRFLTLYDKNLAVRAKLGRLLMRRASFRDALEHLRFAERARPTDPNLALDVAICLANLSRSNPSYIDKARQQYRKVIRLDPNSAQAYYGLSQLELNDENMELAWKYCSLALKINHDYPDALVLAGYLMTRMGDLARAAAYYSAALQIYPKNSPKLSAVGSTYAEILDSIGEAGKARQVRQDYGVVPQAAGGN